MQRGVAIYALGEELDPNIAKWLKHNFCKPSFGEQSLLYEVTGGNLVDGLPPAAHHATGAEQAPLRPNIFMAWRCFNRNVLAIHSSDLNEIAREHTRHAKEDFLRSS